MISSRFEYLTERYVADSLAEAEMVELWELIQADADQARYLLRHLEWDTVLRDVCQSEDYVKQIVLADQGRENIALTRISAPVAVISASSGTVSSRSRKSLLLAVCSLLVLVFLACIPFLVFYVRTEKTPDTESVVAFVHEKKKENVDLNPYDGQLLATVRVSAFVEWADNTELRANRGDRLGPGWIRITSGTLALTLDSGPDIVIDGPAEFQLIGPDRAFCSSGQVFAEVPQHAVGFRIDVPQSKIIDQGTSFGINVQGNQSRVHVISGEVELQNEEIGSKMLKQRESAILSPEGKINSQVRSVMMVNTDPSALHENNTRREFWDAQKDRFNRDPSVLVHFDFEEQSSLTGHVPNLSHLNRKTIPYGKMSGCKITQGPIEKTSALSMERLTDLFQFDFPVDAESITLLLWTRIDSLPQTYNSLFTTDGFCAGEFHWHVLYDGKMEIGVNFDESKPCILMQTEPLLLPWLGRWIFLAVVLDRPNREISMYLNGKKVFYENSFSMPIPFHFTNAQLGNWTFDSTWNPVHQIRHFVGAIDGAVIFNRAISDEEVQTIYDSGYKISIP